MEFIRGLNNLKSYHRSCAATVGNFDGVHIGHQALLKQLIAKGKALNLPTLAITFEPQPNEYFQHGQIPPRLMRLREKVLSLNESGIDRILCLRFNKDLAEISAEKFIKDILVNRLGIKHIIIGDDFRFGRQRAGDLAMLQQFGKDYDFTVEGMSTFILDEQRVSSTRIRKCLEQGDLETAKKLLGQPFFMSGKVAHGNKRGRIIGFPTANIYLHRKVVPLTGVYVVKAWGINNEYLGGVANVGNRPTVDGTRSLLEVHLFNFEQDIYGKHINIEFIHKLREEKKYDSFDLLKQQIMRDAEAARDYLKKILPL